MLEDEKLIDYAGLQKAIARRWPNMAITVPFRQVMHHGWVKLVDIRFGPPRKLIAEKISSQAWKNGHPWNSQGILRRAGFNSPARESFYKTFLNLHMQNNHSKYVFGTIWYLKSGSGFGFTASVIKSQFQI
jgi:hypothetical protein